MTEFNRIIINDQGNKLNGSSPSRKSSIANKEESSNSLEDDFHPYSQSPVNNSSNFQNAPSFPSQGSQFQDIRPIKDIYPTIDHDPFQFQSNGLSSPILLQPTLASNYSSNGQASPASMISPFKSSFSDASFSATPVNMPSSPNNFAPSSHLQDQNLSQMFNQSLNWSRSDSRQQRSPFSQPFQPNGLLGSHSRRHSYTQGISRGRDYYEKMFYNNEFQVSPPSTAPISGSFESSLSGNSNHMANVPQTASGSFFFERPNTNSYNYNYRRSSSENDSLESSIPIENDLLLMGNHIVTSPKLRSLYKIADNYFCVKSAEKVYQKIKSLLDPVASYAYKITSLINFLKRKNDISSIINHSGLTKLKNLCLVCSKSGRIEVLTVSSNSNNLLQKDDLVIVEGDRGKDLMHIIEPTIGLNFVILLNFLKKREHVKAMGGNSLPTLVASSSGATPTSPNMSSVASNNSASSYNQEDEHTFTLPSKQILRFALPSEVEQLPNKFKTEVSAFKIALEKVELINQKAKKFNESENSEGKNPLNLKIFSSEFQFDKKKLFFYYSCENRNDFRDLIKELFKVYKTRIWMCAVLNPDEFNPYSQYNTISRQTLNGSLHESINQTNLNRKNSEMEFELGSTNGLSQRTSLSDPRTSVSDKSSDKLSSERSISERTSISSRNLHSADSVDGGNKREMRQAANEDDLRLKYQNRINKTLLIDENKMDFAKISFDDYHAQNLLNSIENLKIDLNI